MRQGRIPELLGIYGCFWQPLDDRSKVKLACISAHCRIVQRAIGVETPTFQISIPTLYVPHGDQIYEPA